MAVTKAQLVVWALIVGVSAGGYAMLSRVKMPDEAIAQAPVVRAMTAAPQVAFELPVAPQPAAATLPATIPEFPFPDDLVTATVAEPHAATGFAEIRSEAIPQISTVGARPIAAVAAVASAAPQVVAETAEEPPIPMPARPMVAQPVKAVPLSEVKTLYVVADALNVRAAPTTSGPVLQKLPQGFAVAAREQSNEWIGFLMRDGSTGWMRTDYLSDTMPTLASAPATTKPGEPLNLMM